MRARTQLPHYKLLVKDVVMGDLKKVQPSTSGWPAPRPFLLTVLTSVKMPDYWKMPQTSVTYVFFLQHTDFGDYA